MITPIVKKSIVAPMTVEVNMVKWQILVIHFTNSLSCMHLKYSTLQMILRGKFLKLATSYEMFVL